MCVKAALPCRSLSGIFGLVSNGSEEDSANGSNASILLLVGSVPTTVVGGWASSRQPTSAAGGCGSDCGLNSEGWLGSGSWGEQLKCRSCIEPSDWVMSVWVPVDTKLTGAGWGCLDVNCEQVYNLCWGSVTFWRGSVPLSNGSNFIQWFSGSKKNLFHIFSHILPAGTLSLVLKIKFFVKILC